MSLTNPKDDVIKNILTCCVCEVTYTLLTSLRLLPCAHIFCVQCLSSWIKESRDNNRSTFECPLCRKTHCLPNTTVEDEWPHPHFFSGFLKQESKSCDPSYCSLHGTSKEAQYVCKTCKSHFCKACKDVHLFANKDHDVIAQQIEKVPKEKPRNCSIHASKSLEIFCRDCKEMSCALCGVFGKHKGHACIEIHEAAAEFKERIKVKLTEVAEREKVAEYSLTKIRESSATFEKSISHYLDDVDRRAEMIIAEVKHYQEELRQTLLQERNRLKKHYDCAVKYIELHMEAVQKYTKLLSTENDANIIDFVVSNGHVFDDASFVSDFLPTNLSTTITYQHSDDITKVKDIFGHIVIGNSRSKSNSTATESIPKSKVDNCKIVNSDMQVLNTDCSAVNEQTKKSTLVGKSCAENKFVIVHPSEIKHFKYKCKAIICLAKCDSRGILIGKLQDKYSTVDYHAFHGTLMLEVKLSHTSLHDVCCHGSNIYTTNCDTGEIDVYNKDNGAWQKTIKMKTKGDNGICASGNILFVTSEMEHLVYSLDLSKEPLERKVVIKTTIKRPSFVASNSSLLVVSCTNYNKVHVFNHDGTICFSFGGNCPGKDNDHLNWPRKVCIDAKGNIFISDCRNHRIVMLSCAGILLKHFLVTSPDHFILDIQGNLHGSRVQSNELHKFKIK